MRYIFVDEAGTSAHEPVTVVVGIIADADQHVRAAENLVSEILQGVPLQHRKQFTFHATRVFGDKRYQSDWLFNDRLHLLESMMSVPRRIGMAITLSARWRNAVDHTELAEPLRLSQSQFEHVMAFGECLAIADRNIRRHAHPNEVASVVAEDIPEMRRFLKIVPKMYRENPFHCRPEHLRETPQDKEAGYSTQRGELRIARIRNSVHFVEKSEDPLVQVADACAYGFRRYFAEEKFGDVFARAILGHESLLRNFASPGGTECWWPN
ncbi:DUF3800 domain-containing protein [Aquabacterium sp.]|uniref:DUF3800 domain-containing protein n=1 Tax=Aquabacterium sp. TaxID=1872578 RepID=UPI002E3113FD|nr:DUF3800 domain-containing protein [Aquabacterium sp.]HEX5312292.1 DUF3800 domain-containing protein [Aquabacterium sp.]